jgi:uncharacterized membrane protein
LEISQQEFEQLIQRVRELTARVYRLETVLKVQPPQPEEPRPTPAAQSVLTPPPPAPQHVESPALPTFAAQAGAPDAVALEARIGSHWLNRIGIAAVLIGVSYFLKFAFENNWIGPAGRIAIGLISGIAVVLWSERFRDRGYRIFSYSLKAVGIGVLYLSLWASFQIYHLAPSGVVFVFMLVVTGATCTMAITQDAEILAVFAIIGGFSTPLLLSTGENREIALFSYLMLLDLGMLALVYLKPWRRLLFLAFLGTLILYFLWYAEFYTRPQLTSTLIFATLFFSVFAAASLLMLRQEQAAGTMPLILALVNAAAYFSQAYGMIYDVSHAAMAWFSLALAAVYLGLNRVRPGASEPAGEHNLRLMHLALAVGLVTVAIPIRLEANWITIGWFIEAGLLLWIAGRANSDLLNVFALTALVLGVGRLLLIDNFEFTRLIFNPRMAVYSIAIAVLAFAAYQASRRGDETGKAVAMVAIVSINALALIALSREVADYYQQQIALARPLPGPWRSESLSQYHSLEIARDFTYSALWMAYGAMLMIVGFWRKSAFVRWQALVLIAFTIGKVFISDIRELERIYRILSFVALGVLLLAISFAYQRDWLKLSPARARGAGGASS